MTKELEKKLQHYRISRTEFSKMVEILGREPEGVEWAVFSALWSEHCSYKSSKVHLKKFYSKNSRVKEAFGENAGVIDLGEGERVAFKMESHNHPSFISPYQGAATGVGGILRDIFTMGARPVALANYLCFGQPEAERMTEIVDGVVRGIADYGNCVGVPMLAGATEFNADYDQNVLVNAFALGLFNPEDKIFTSSAGGIGNLVVYVGAKTGRDGVHGASMASESFDEESESKKPTIQIGDPFFEKLLIEGCLEVMKENLVESIQDMGAAGITSSSFEMAAKGEVGFKLDLDTVPQRDLGISPEEILLSESQERMLLISKPENLKAIQEIFSRWSLDAVAIGEVVEGTDIELFWHGEKLAQLSPAAIVDNAPVYERSYSEWQDQNRVELVADICIEPKGLKESLESIFSSTPGMDKNWIYQQYDQRVGAATARDCSEPVGVIHLKNSGRALGITTGCRPYVMKFDAKQGALDSIFYPALKLAAKGFLPLAVTDCLNFGNPEKPEIMSEFVASVESMSAACEALDTPVISGNVSFYNETQVNNIIPTPATAVVGLKKDIQKIPASYFENENEAVYLLSMKQLKTTGQWGSLAESMKGFGEINIPQTSRLVTWLRDLVSEDICSAVNVCGRYGVLNTLARMSAKGVGIDINESLALSDLSLENFYEIVVSMPAGHRQKFTEFCEKADGLEVVALGRTQLQGISYKEELVEREALLALVGTGWEKNFETLA